MNLAFLVCSAQSAVRDFYGASRSDPWTEKEYQILRQYYIDKGSEYCSRLLPGRTIHSIRHAARRIGVIRFECRQWTVAELDIVIEGMANDQSAHSISRTLVSHGYSRSPVAVRDCRVMIRNKYLSDLGTIQISEQNIFSLPSLEV